MSGPARAGAMLYAKRVDHLAAIYQRLLGMRLMHCTDELTVIESPDFQLVVHAMPPHISSTVSITMPPMQRDSAVRLFFTVSSLANARTVAARLGGEVFHETWDGPGFRVSNACDPEGNVFQLREPAAVQATA